MEDRKEQVGNTQWPLTLGMIQQLRNAVVAPTGMGKNYAMEKRGYLG